MMHEAGTLLVPNGRRFITNPHEYPMVNTRCVAPCMCIYLGSFVQLGVTFFWVMLPSGEVVSTFAEAVKDVRV